MKTMIFLWLVIGSGAYFLFNHITKEKILVIKLAPFEVVHDGEKIVRMGFQK